MSTATFFGDLKRRNVIRFAGLYLVGAWLVTQVSSTILPMFGAPDWLPRSIVVLLALGLVPALIFSWVFELTPEGLKRDEQVLPEESIAPQTARRMDRVIIAVLVVALAYFCVDKFVLNARRQAVVVAPAGKAIAATEANAKSIAVLPFDNLSDDKANAYFAEGIQDEILTHLSKIAALKVISRTSTQKYKSAPDNLREIGGQLGVASILEGSVQKIGNAAHINVQLIRAATDEHLWAESYNRKLDDVFSVEGEVAAAIAEQLDAKLTGAEHAALAQTPTNNAAAYDAYLRGLGSSAVTPPTPDSFKAAVQSFEEAVRIDPQFALAWAKLCRAQSISYFNYIDRSEARRAAAANSLGEALRLQPQLPEAQLAKAGFQYWVLLDYKGARDLFEQLHLSWPSNADIVQDLGWVTARLGDRQKSAEYLEQAIGLNPRDLYLRVEGIKGRLALRDFAAVHRMANEALRIWPGDASLLGLKVYALQATGELDQAQAIIDRAAPGPDRERLNAEQAILRRTPALALPFFQHLEEQPVVSPSDVSDLLNFATLLEQSGDKAKARAMFLKARDALAIYLKGQPDVPVALALRAYTLAALGERDAALSAIDQALASTANDARTHGAVEELKAPVLTRLGEKAAAIALLQHLLEIPYDGTPPVTPALLRLDPEFDSLRGDPRFEKLCQDKQP